MEASSPRNASGAISAPVLTPVTRSNCGRAMSPLTLPQPLSTPAPNEPQSPPPEITSRSIVGRVEGADEGRVVPAACAVPVDPVVPVVATAFIALYLARARAS